MYGPYSSSCSKLKKHIFGLLLGCNTSFVYQHSEPTCPIFSISFLDYSSVKYHSLHGPCCGVASVEQDSRNSLFLAPQSYHDAALLKQIDSRDVD